MTKGIFVAIIGFVIVAISVAGLLLYIDNQEQKKEKGDLQIATSIYPVYDIAKNIVGDEIEVVNILPSGQSPHTYEPTASAQARLSEVDTLFVIGLKFDSWAEDVAKGANSNVEIIDMSKFVEVMEFEDDHEHGHDDDEDHNEDGEEYETESEHHEDEGEHETESDHHEDEEEHKGEEEHMDEAHDEEDHGHEHGEFDPHYWLSIDNAKIIAEIIADEASKLDESKRSEFEENLENYLAKLDELKSESEEKLAEFDDIEIITFHGGFNYFAKQFEIEVVATVEEFPGQTPSAAYLAEIGEVIEETEVKVLFKEPQLSDVIVDALAEDYGATVKTLDPLGGVDGRDSFIKMIEFNVEQVVEGVNE